MSNLRTCLTIRWFSTEDRRGFTILELLIVVVIVGLLASMAVPVYTDLLDRARVTKAIGDISAIGQNITEFQLTNDRMPATLAELGMSAFNDPWGNPYQYLPIEGAKKGQLRKDKFLVPINSDFDLYSMGPDGKSVSPLTAKASHDDIIRANDGGFVGVAEDF